MPTLDLSFLLHHFGMFFFGASFFLKTDHPDSYFWRKTCLPGFGHVHFCHLVSSKLSALPEMPIPLTNALVFSFSIPVQPNMAVNFCAFIPRIESISEHIVTLKNDSILGRYTLRLVIFYTAMRTGLSYFYWHFPLNALFGLY